jgi:3-phytase
MTRLHRFCRLVAATVPFWGAVTALAGDDAVSLPAARETAPTLQDDGNDVAFWLHPSDPARSLVLGSAGTAGLEIFGLDGQPLGRYADAEIDYLDVLYGFGNGPLIVAYDRRSGTVRAYGLDASTSQVVPKSGTPLTPGGEVTGLCGYRSPLTGLYYVFLAVEGSLQQWSIHEQAGTVGGRLLRSIPLGVGAGYCAVDDQAGTVYATEESVGIWAIAAEPEAEAARSPLDLVAPYGHLAEEVKGVAVYRSNTTEAYLVAVDVAAERINVYSLVDRKYVGSVALGGAAASGGAAAIDAVGEAEGIAVTPLALGSFTTGALAIVDEDNDGSPMNVKLVGWSEIAARLGLPAPAATLDPRAPAAPTAHSVQADVETTPVDTYGDAADDPAIWVHPTDPAKSLVIGTNKKLGLDVYDLDGKRVQQLADGRLNNVDLRDGFKLGSKEVTLVVASNRTDKTIAVYAIDPATARLADVAAEKIPTGLSDPYGICMYHDRRSNRFFAFVNDGADGAFRQWELYADGASVRAKRVRDFAVGSQAEGCVADDRSAALYVAEEDVGIWRYPADPRAGVERRQVDSTGAGGNLSADVEGIGLYARPDGTGYIVASSQGTDNFAVYRLEGANEFVGYFWIVANDELGIDGVSETDGLEVTSAALGSRFPDGALVAQDGRNITPSERQNFKFVSWTKIARALGLDASR